MTLFGDQEALWQLEVDAQQAVIDRRARATYINNTPSQHAREQQAHRRERAAELAQVHAARAAAKRVLERKVARLQVRQGALRASSARIVRNIRAEEAASHRRPSRPPVLADDGGGGDRSLQPRSASLFRGWRVPRWAPDALPGSLGTGRPARRSPRWRRCRRP